jgi:preprotein translocase subunit SecG
LETFLYIVFFLSCLVLIVSVLLQPGKTDAGALFTSGVSKAALNPRGTQSVLSKLTIVTAAVFMLSALLLTLPALTGNVSVLETQGATNSSNTNANTNANASNANAANANANTSNANAGAANASNTAENANAPADANAAEPEAEKPSEKPEANTAPEKPAEK